ncbi:hypothetical protein [Nonomuraea sp. JJY05]|uniref:hypothetical protein n=1 Tax=Nonomuraea sp. JJY05 TaxID=3350255 RepID=UPI00373F40DB
MSLQRATSAGRASRAGRQDPGTEAWSESWSRTVAPPRSPAATVASTEPGVAAASQSRPQTVHNTGRNPRSRAETSASRLSAP